MSAENSAENSMASHLAPYQFKPGESGNPGGRPKKTPVTDSLCLQLDMPIPETMLGAMKESARAVFLEVFGPKPTFAQMVAFKLVQSSAKGDVFALKELLDRAEGKVAQRAEIAGKDGGPVEFVVKSILEEK